MRHVKGLEAAIGMTVVDPIRDERGWAFREPSGGRRGARPESIERIASGNEDDTEVVPPSTDPINGFHFLSEAYQATDPNFDGRVTCRSFGTRKPNGS